MDPMSDIRTLKPSEVLELRRLYDLISDTAAGASDVLGAPSSVSRGVSAQRFDGVVIQLRDIVNRIDAILATKR